jgi:maltose alpha-D-glucosyltransferase/alpha-amylase
MINDLCCKNAIIYCLSVAIYMDANGNGTGDFQGMAITALGRMQFQTTPHRDDGYDVAAFRGVKKIA